ncbi:MAG: 1,4-dihydroxy-2-naphthoate octaprenyltransferase [Tenacibaculum sp.]
MIKNYIKAARLRTLPLSVSGIIVGATLGVLSLHEHNLFKHTHKICTICLEGKFQREIFIFCLSILTTLSFQILSNFANDYGDAIKGADSKRKVELRMVSSGAISYKQIKRAIAISAILALLFSLLLIYTAFEKNNLMYTVLYFGLAIACIAAAIKYTVGKQAYGYKGFGDVFVFLFFGLLAVVGTYFLYTKQLKFAVFLPSFSIGLLSVAVLNLNNMRDRENDKLSAKNTLVVKIGVEFAKYYHYYLIAASLLFALLYTLIEFKSTFQFLFLLTYIPLAKHLHFVATNKNEILLNGELKKVAMSTFLFAVLFSLGQIL